MSTARRSLELIANYERAVRSGDLDAARAAARELDAWDRARGLSREERQPQPLPYRPGEVAKTVTLGEARAKARKASSLERARPRGQEIRRDRVRAAKALGLSRERLDERFRACAGLSEQARRSRDEALRFRGWKSSDGTPCPRFEPADETGPLDEDPCCACLRRYDEHAKPRGVPCLDFRMMLSDGEGWADPGALSGDEPCDACGHSLDEHAEAAKYREPEP